MACVRFLSDLTCSSRLMIDRFSLTPTSFPKTAFLRGCIAQCTMRLGMRLMGPTMDSIGEIIGTLCPGLIAFRLCE